MKFRKIDLKNYGDSFSDFQRKKEIFFPRFHMELSSSEKKIRIDRSGKKNNGLNLYSGFILISKLSSFGKQVIDAFPKKCAALFQNEAVKLIISFSYWFFFFFFFFFILCWFSFILFSFFHIENFRRLINFTQRPKYAYIKTEDL